MSKKLIYCYYNSFSSKMQRFLQKISLDGMGGKRYPI
jgi:hypothetical protein